MKLKYFLFVFALWSFPHILRAEFVSDNLDAIAAQSDGKILVAGHIDTLKGPLFAVARYHNGKLDPSFGKAGILTVPSTQEESKASAVLVMPNDDFFVAGSKKENDRESIILLGFHSTGELIESFGNKGLLTVPSLHTSLKASALTLGKTGELYIGGYGPSNNESVFVVAAITKEGTAIPTFGKEGIASYPIHNPNTKLLSLAVDRDQTVVLSGYADTKLQPFFITFRIDYQGNIASGEPGHEI